MSRVYEPSDLAVAELDLVKYLDHHQQLLMNTCIEEATKMTANAFRKHYIGKMDDDWERAKRDILERVGFRSGSKGLASAFAMASPHYAHRRWPGQTSGQKEASRALERLVRGTSLDRPRVLT